MNVRELNVEAVILALVGSAAILVQVAILLHEIGSLFLQRHRREQALEEFFRQQE